LKPTIVDLERETVAGALLLGRLRPAGRNEIGKTIKIPLERGIRRINAPFNDCHLVHFDIAVRALLKPSGLWAAFNRLHSTHDQPVIGCGAACASLRQ
jgi:hypothetical protein